MIREQGGGGLEKVKVETAPPTIRLEFFRHDQKTKETTAGPRPDDEAVMLTAAGRHNATEIGVTKFPRAALAVAYGSPRLRSVESAMRQMLANEGEITDAMSLDEIRAVIAKHLKKGEKDIIDPRLNFNTEGTAEFKVAFDQHYLESKDAVHFYFEDSDRIVLQSHDQASTCYSRAAANVAEIVERYMRMLHQWKQIVSRSENEYDEIQAAEKRTSEAPDDRPAAQKKREKQRQATQERYRENNNEMQRFIGSHHTVLEPFLMKVIEKTAGREAVLEFITSLANPNGFEVRSLK